MARNISPTRTTKGDQGGRPVERRPLRDRSVVRRRALAHDASHYLQVPSEIATPHDVGELLEVLAGARRDGQAVTFRSGGTSLSGQSVTDGVLIDTRQWFRDITVEDGGESVRVRPGATVRIINAHLARLGRRLGPDPASEIACTIGGVIANNSSGMSCGVEQNAYRTLRDLVFVLPNGTIVDTAVGDADERLAAAEPELHTGLIRLRDRVRADSAMSDEIRRAFSIKNTMGYSVNAFLDFDRPVDILAHLMVGSEGTLGWIAEAVLRTVPIDASVATSLVVFSDLEAAMRALPALVATGLSAIELMDSRALQLAGREHDAPAVIAELTVDEHAALLVEASAVDADELAGLVASAAAVIRDATGRPTTFTSDPVERAALWHVRKGLYPTVAGARPSGTTTLLEDVAVPVAQLGELCRRLSGSFDDFGYHDAVIFGHAKDGNVHFMITEDFGSEEGRTRYARFTDMLVELVLTLGGTLKAEHGTGRVMAPFVRRQYGDDIFDVMQHVKRLCDPAGVLSPGIVLTNDTEAHLRYLKSAPTVESEVDRCVECGYCEPTCPSKDLTLTPRQRIVLRRELEDAKARGDDRLVLAIENEYRYEGEETCAVDGMCSIACPVSINTGDLVRRLRTERKGGAARAGWNVASHAWSAVTGAGSVALDVAAAVPPIVPVAATRAGRAILGDDTVPLYDAGLPAGGTRRGRLPHGRSIAPMAVHFSACVGSMFGSDGDGEGVSAAFRVLADRVGIGIRSPKNIDGACCGTPWKSKGHAAGYAAISERTLSMLFESSEEGKLPIVCDASSCTEGLILMRDQAVARGERKYSTLQIIDAVEFVSEHLLDRLTIERQIDRLALHPTCSSRSLEIDAALNRIAEAVSNEVVTPIDWNCCAFAGDRGMLHPELTASATEREAAEIRLADCDAHASLNRTCEIAMTRATGAVYEHVLEILERASRVPQNV